MQKFIGTLRVQGHALYRFTLMSTAHLPPIYPSRLIILDRIDSGVSVDVWFISLHELVFREIHKTGDCFLKGSVLPNLFCIGRTLK